MKGLLVFALIGFALVTGIAGLPFAKEEDAVPDDEIKEIQEDFAPEETEL